MYTKIIALIIQTYLVIKAITPPTPALSIKKILSTEGLLGISIAYIVPSTSFIFVVSLLSIYIYIMYQQEIGSIPILPDENHKFSDWNLLEMVCFGCTVGGALLRLWCYDSLKEFFTFNVIIKEDHKLIDTGPYSLIIHPSVSVFFFKKKIMIMIDHLR